MWRAWRDSGRVGGGGGGRPPPPPLFSASSSHAWWSARKLARRLGCVRGVHRPLNTACTGVITAIVVCAVLLLLLLLLWSLLGSVRSPLTASSSFELPSLWAPLPPGLFPASSSPSSAAGGSNHYSAASAVDDLYPPSLYDRPASSFAFPLTVVTAYYPFPSKHSSDNYHRWLTHFLSNFTTPMIIFTSPAAYPLLASLRYAGLFVNCTPAAFSVDSVNALHLVQLPLRPGMSLLDYRTHWRVEFPSPLDIPLLQSFSSTFASQLQLDPERAKHSPLLYATWTAKPFLVNLSASLNPFHSKLFMWMDAGQLRNPHTRVTRFPHTPQLERLFHDHQLPASPPYPLYQPSRHPHPSASAVSSRQHKVVMVLVHPYTPAFCQPLYPERSHPPHLLLDHHAGQSFIATLHSARWYSQLYYHTAKQWAERDWLIGKDQTLMNALVQGYRGSFIVVGAWKVEADPQCWMGVGWDAHWSWMAAFLAADDERLTACGAADGQHEANYDADRMAIEAQDVCSPQHAVWRSRRLESTATN